MEHAQHAQSKHGRRIHTKSPERSYGVGEVTRVTVEGSLMPLASGNYGASGDWLAKTSVFMSAVALGGVFRACRVSVWIQRLFLVASASSLGEREGTEPPRA